ncbi:MAG: J domain-containing protein [Treponema sp.]
MADYYETLGAILRNQLGTQPELFSQAAERKTKASSSTARTAHPYHTTVEAGETAVRVPVPQALVEDFAILQVLPGVPLFYCKQARNHLLKKYHPDFAPDEKAQQEAAAIVRRINRSYKKIETWFLTGSIADE